MRLIDADALAKDIETYNRPLCDDYHMKGYVLDQIITDIKNAPTVEAVPVVHGHWQNIGDLRDAQCSVCGKWLDVLQGSADMNYCPNCGSKMDEV